MANASLDLDWWKKNAPDSIAKGEVQKALTDLGKLKASLKKDKDPTDFVKGVEKLLKTAIPKDEAAGKKGKDAKDVSKVLGQLKGAAEEAMSETNDQFLGIGKIGGGAPSGRSGIAVPKPDLAEATSAGKESGDDEGGGGGGGGVSVSDIVNLAKATWEIVKDNAPSAAAKTCYCQAMPSKKQLSWEQLSGWQTATSDWAWTMNTQFDDLFGTGPHIAVDLHLEYDFGGRSSKTAGLFLNNFTVWCKKIEVGWGWTVNIDATTQGNPKNIGSEKAPVGAIQLRVALQVQSKLAVRGVEWGLTAGGDGSFRAS